MVEQQISIAVAAVIAVLLLVVEHYAPWLRGLGAARPVVNYVMGCLALFVPYTLLIWFWIWHGVIFSSWLTVIALWIIAGAGGLAVIACYAVDSYIERGVKLRETLERENQYRQSLRGIRGGDEGTTL